jgi:hypothetical protein
MVAGIASIGQVIERRWPAVLSGDDVIRLVGDEDHVIG